MEDEEDGLKIVGYSSSIFPPDEASQRIADEKHLRNWLDTDIKIDRYDVRLFFNSITDVRVDHNSSVENCSSEALEEEMCDVDRYMDLNSKPERAIFEEDVAKPKRAEIGFSYDEPMESAVDKIDNPDSDSEDEAFEAPEGIKLPMGLVCPANQKQNHIILRTAGFVVEKGAQMEIVIKAKQRDNNEHFGFLQFDNQLHPYYKYMMKMIREKKYKVPDFDREKMMRRKLGKNPPTTTVPTASESLKTSNSTHSLGLEYDDDSDSDYELHPLLSVSSAPAAPVQQAPPVSVQKSRNDLLKNLKSTDTHYTSLFRNLVELKVKSATEEDDKGQPIANAGPDLEFQKWWSFFYEAPCPISKPAPIKEPPAEQLEVIEHCAEYSAKYGAEGERMLREQHVLDGAQGKYTFNLGFLNLHSPYHSYYQQKVKAHQEELGYYPPEPAPLLMTVEPPPGFVPEYQSLADAIQVSAPSPPLNRKQRRRLQDAPKADIVVPVSVIDPCTSQTVDPGQSQVSFHIAANSSKLTAPQPTVTALDEDITDAYKAPIPKPPTPPTIQTDLQLERKEKARQFMERILRDKQQRAREAAQEKESETVKVENGKCVLPSVCKEERERKESRRHSRDRSRSRDRRHRDRSRNRSRMRSRERSRDRKDRRRRSGSRSKAKKRRSRSRSSSESGKEKPSKYGRSHKSSKRRRE